MKDELAAGRNSSARSLIERARQGSHGNIVAHQQSGKSKPIPNHITDHSDRSRGGSKKIVGGGNQKSPHPQRKNPRRANNGQTGSPKGGKVRFGQQGDRQG